MDTLQQQRAANKKSIIALMKDPLYNLCLGFYPDALINDPTFGFKERNLLPQLSWTITELRVHPCGKLAGSHWRLSLRTATGERTFFNNSVEYLKNGYGQVRIGPGRDDYGPSQTATANALDCSFTIALKDSHHTLGDFVNAILHPTAYADDGVKQDKPMCWYFYTGYKEFGNRECRHWVQSAVRAFYRAGLVMQDPTELFKKKNKELGWPDKEIPKGTFFDHRPGTVAGDPGTVNPLTQKPQPALEAEGGGDGVSKGVGEQALLEQGFPGWI